MKESHWVDWPALLISTELHPAPRRVIHRVQFQFLLIGEVYPLLQIRDRTLNLRRHTFRQVLTFCSI